MRERGEEKIRGETGAIKKRKKEEKRYDDRMQGFEA